MAIHAPPHRLGFWQSIDGLRVRTEVDRDLRSDAPVVFIEIVDEAGHVWKIGATLQVGQSGSYWHRGVRVGVDECLISIDSQPNANRLPPPLERTLYPP